MKLKDVLRYCVIAILAIWTVGCRTTGRLDLKITGVSSESSVPGDYTFTDLSKLRVNKRPVTACRSFSPYEVVETDQIVKLEVFRAPKFDYVVLLGADLVSGKPGRAWIKTSDPKTVVDSGWALLWGRQAVAETRWVSVVPDGTTYVIQIVDDSLQRIYLIDGNRLYVKCKVKDSTEFVTLGVEETFIDVKCDGTDCIFAGPTDIAADAGAKAFIDKVKEIAADAGWIG